jgi:cytochrome c oxidase cbb3-type subunit 2
MIEKAVEDLEAQSNLDADWDDLLARYPKAVTRDFDGNPEVISELDALVAYLQMLGTLVDYDVFDPDADNNER